MKNISKFYLSDILGTERQEAPGKVNNKGRIFIALCLLEGLPRGHFIAFIQLMIPLGNFYTHASLESAHVSHLTLSIEKLNDNLLLGPRTSHMSKLYVSLRTLKVGFPMNRSEHVGEEDLKAPQHLAVGVSAY